MTIPLRLHRVRPPELGSLLSVAVTIGLGSSLVAPAALGQPARVIDLLTFGTPAGELTRVYGTTGNGARGIPVAGGHDVDGDGLADSAFSAVTADPLGRSNAGETVVVFGDGSLGDSLTTEAFTPGLLKIAGQHPCEISGVEIEMADVTGDGVGDLLIGRQNHSPSSVTRPGAGALTIIVGGEELRDHASTLAYLDLAAMPVTIDATTFVGAASHDRFGVWMRAGDVDGDGISDIVVGADQVDKMVGITLEDDRGAAYVIRGGAHLAAPQTIDLATFGTGSFPAALEGHVALLEPPAGAANYHFGATVQIGDLDGDDKGEVIAAAALNRSNAGLGTEVSGDDCIVNAEASGGSPDGSVFIAWDENFPATAWSSGYTIDFTPPLAANLTRIDGSPSDPANSEFGEELLAGLDYDGDGAPDLFVGDLIGDGGNGFGSGLGHVLFGVNELRDETWNVGDLIESPPAGFRHTLILGPPPFTIGADTATHGDYDGDGLADLAMCNPKDSPLGRASAGTVHVLYGEIDGWPATIDLAPAGLPSPEAVRIVEIRGALGNADADSGDTLCYSAAGGDVDGDGVPDLVINEMEGNGLAPDGADDGEEPDPAIDVGNLLLVGGAPLLDRVLLDVDGDGEAKPLTDGILIVRFLFGLRGAALTNGAVDPAATRSPADIETYLARAGAALDADADDALQALTDGLLIVRHLFGLTGANLTQGAVDPDARRVDPAAIAAFLERLMPAP